LTLGGRGRGKEGRTGTLKFKGKGPVYIQAQSIDVNCIVKPMQFAGQKREIVIDWERSNEQSEIGDERK
jgi:hypothetical protein